MRKPIIIAAVFALAGCAYHAPAAPSSTTTNTPPAVPTSVNVQATLGIGVSATNAFVSATVVDANGHGVAAVPVTFATSNGSLSATSTTTDLGGLARTVLTSGLPATVTASASGLSGSTLVAINAAIHASISGSSTITTGAVTSYTLTSFDATAPLTVSWAFGDGAATSGGATSHAYGRPGTYAITAHVVDALGRTSDAAQTITVSDPPSTVTTTPAPPPTVAALTATLTCTAQTHGTLTPCNLAASYGSTQLASTAITSTAWDFGDGTTTTVANSPLVTRNYGQAGSYIIVAAVTAMTSDGSKTTTVSKTIAIP